jgi:hypothetical protein
MVSFAHAPPRPSSLEVLPEIVDAVGGKIPVSSAAAFGAAPPRGVTAPFSHQDWPTGPYRVIPEWPKPLPDDLHSHAGWTWGSFGGVYAESPDRIWIAMRGELPLPEGAAPWTPYVELPPYNWNTRAGARGTAQGGADGMSATCTAANPRGWERRWQHSIIVVDGQGNLIDYWAHLEKMFDDPARCGRGPHQIKMIPYDPEKHVWIIDDQLHMIYKFTYNGRLVYSHGEYGRRADSADVGYLAAAEVAPNTRPRVRTRELLSFPRLITARRGFVPMPMLTALLSTARPSVSRIRVADGASV